MKGKWILTAIISAILIIGTGNILSVQAPENQDVAGYYVSVNGQSTGPYDANGLRQLIQTGQLTKSTLVWKEGMTSWIIAGTVKEFDSLFASTPTPPPLAAASPPPPPAVATQPSFSSQQLAGYENFTTGQRWGTWALNALVVPGLGSYVVMHDWVGGSVMLGLSITGSILVASGIVSIMNASITETVYDSSSYYGGYYTEYRTDESKLTSGIIVASIGGVVLLAEGIYNIVRSVSYNKPAPKITTGFDPSALNIVVLPGKEGIDKVYLSYTMSF
jgi:hypothetical protein